MKDLFKIGLGFVLGVFATISFLSTTPEEQKTEEEPDEVQSEVLQYFEIQGPKGEVTLHIGMEKDSVRILLGKPRSVDVDSNVLGTFEEWSYRVRSKYIEDLTISFENGELKSVRQY